MMQAQTTMQSTSYTLSLFAFRYDHERGRFTDPPSVYTATVDKTENYKYCESCVRKKAQEQVTTNNFKY